MPGRDPSLSRYSPLDQISVVNIAALKPVWSFSTGVLGPHEGSPLVIGSTMFVHTPWPNTVFALDLRASGAIKWRYQGPLPRPARGARAGTPGPPPTGCCDIGSRGLAYHPSGKLFVPLLAGDIAALDAETGREIWRVRNGDPATGATVAAAPIVVRDLVIAGVSGAGFGVRGHLTAYDANTGRLVWRGYSTGPDSEVLISGAANTHYSSHQGRDLGLSTWPGDAWRLGGGTTSGWISYDPALDLIFHGTDEPAPGNPSQRSGDNKWASSILAREATTGRVRWAYQLTPHDEWGYGAGNESILVDVQIGGAKVPSLVHFARNGFAYTIERSTGKVLVAQPFGPVNWASLIEQESGVPGRASRFAAPPPTPAGSPTRRTSGICPAALGGKHLQPAAHSPLTGLFYVPASNLCMDLSTAPATHAPGAPYSGTTIRMQPGPGGNRGRLLAWDPGAAVVTWEIKEPFAVAGGVLATAGGLLFYGTMEGWLKALDQRTGREVWRYKTPSGIVGSPIAFLGPDGRQYVAVYSGIGGWWGLGGNGAFPDLASVTNPGGVLTVFGL
jgi:PQQ-dependent dehydrogenase (methanol/ethanol family)